MENQVTSLGSVFLAKKGNKDAHPQTLQLQQPTPATQFSCMVIYEIPIVESARTSAMLYHLITNK